MNHLKNNATTENKTRSSSTELLRIIACLMVLSLHYFEKGTDLVGTFSEANKINIYLSYLIVSLSIGAVNIFMLITGYHGINSRGFTARRIIDIVLLSGFYGVLCYALSVAFGQDTLSADGIYSALFPELCSKIWYVSVYLIMLFIIPIVNPILQKLSKKNFLILIAVLVLIFSIIPFFISDIRKGYDIYQYFLMYVIGAYIALHVKKRNSVLCLGVFLLAVGIGAVIRAYVGQRFMFGRNCFEYISIFVIIASVAIFTFFVFFNFNSKLINTIAKGTLGIYIMNVFCGMNIEKLYYELIGSMKFETSKLMLVHFVASVFGFFIAGFAIDFVRDLIHKKVVAPVLDKFNIINTRISAKIQ